MSLDKEARNLWEGLHTRWLASLSGPDRQAFDALQEETERDAFRIILNYHQFAVSQRRKDFAIVRDDLAGRLGITGQGAGALIKRLSERRIIARVREYVPHKFAARYAWFGGES